MAPKADQVVGEWLLTWREFRGQVHICPLLGVQRPLVLCLEQDVRCTLALALLFCNILSSRVGNTEVSGVCFYIGEYIFAQ